MPDEKTCANCGYLAVRHYKTRQLLDAEQAFRDRGHIPDVPVDHRQSVPAYDADPICFIRSVNLKEKGTGRGDERRQSIVQTVTCERHTAWLQGFTPKEHWQMNQEVERLRLQAQREAEDKAERERRDQQARDFQASQAEQARRHQNRSLFVSVATVGIAILALVINTVIGVLKKPPTIIVQPTPQQAASQSATPSP